MHQFLQTSKYTTPIHLFPNYVTTSTESSTPKVSSFFNNMFGIRVKIALAGKGVEYEYWLQGRGFWLTTANSFWRWNQFITESLFSSTMGNQCVNPSSLFSTFFFFFFNTTVQYSIDEVWKEKSQLLPSDAQAWFWADYVNKQVWSIDQMQITIQLKGLFFLAIFVLNLTPEAKKWNAPKTFINLVTIYWIDHIHRGKFCTKN